MPRILCFLFLLLALGSSAGEVDEDQFRELSISELEQRLTEIDSTLDKLARFTVRSGTGSSGYRSKLHRSPNSREVFRFEWSTEAVIDQVVLVPTLYRNSNEGVRSEGFPLEFRIVVGTADSTHEVARFSKDDQLPTRIAPLSVSFAPVKATWVEVQATTLQASQENAHVHYLQLSEVFVFSGMQNVLQRTVDTIETSHPHSYAMRRGYLTDGFTPFVMNSSQGEKSHTQIIKVTSREEIATLIIDLKTPQPVHQINLHSADVPLSVPMRELSCWASPRHIRVMGAKHANFSDEQLLCEFEQHSIFDAGPILMKGFAETTCRYIKLEILDPHSVLSFRDNEVDFSFSEVEVLSEHQNIAQGSVITASNNLKFRKKTLEKITDGFNNYGTILPLRDWMNQLSQRHDLEHERPLVASALKFRYRRQQANLQVLTWVVALLLAGFIIGLLAMRLLHQKKMAKLRVRFAADLHDELGANLHTIALLSDAANVAHESTDEWKMLHRRIRDLAGSTGSAIRNFSNISNIDGLYNDLIDDMKRVSRRILAKLEHTLEISGKEHLARLKSHQQVDLFLFYKEGLMNICRHSDATRANTQLAGSQQEITLTITDNGKGLSDQGIPSALKRRARMLKAKVSVQAGPQGGTSVRLRLRNRKHIWNHNS